MNQRRIAVLATLAALVASRGPAAAEAPSRTFEDKNFQWTLPSDKWSFEEPSEDDRGAGFVAIARRTVSPGVQVDGWARVAESGGSELEPLLTQVREAKEARFSDTTVDGPKAVRWAGAPAMVLRLTGKADNGSAVAFRVYAALADGVLHMLDIRMTNGAETQVAQEVDALAAGYRLLKGGEKGGEGALPPGHPPVAPDGGGETPGAGDAPAPTDALTRAFPNQNLSWTLPAADAAAPPSEGGAEEEGGAEPPAGEGEGAEAPGPKRWGWARDEGDPNLAKGGKGLLSRGLMVLGEEIAIVISVFVQPSAPGATAAGIVTNTDLSEDITKNAFSGNPVPRIDEDVKIGNWRGAVLILTGKSKGEEPKPFQYRAYFAILKNVVYEIHVQLRQGAEKKYAKDLKAALSGLKWADTKENVRGPIATPFPQHTEPRGKGLNEERKFPTATFSLVKPAVFAQLEYPATSNEFQTWRFAAEARKDQTYCFVGVQSWAADSFTKQKPPRAPETLIDEAEGEWKNAVLDAATRPKSEKTNRASGEFGRHRASTYEFRGTADRRPWLERGYLFKGGQQVFLVRIQYGGQEAEAAFAAEVKALMKSFSIEK